MRLSESLRREADPIWRRIIEHPFVVELYTGSLDFERFKYYVIQDYNYLLAMVRVFSIIASKADLEVASKALEIARADATVELENYKRLLARIGLTLDEVVNAKPAPTNVGYMSYLISTASLGDALEGFVAVLPCFWSYLEIARVHEEKLARNNNEVYVEWAKAYLSSEYEKLVEDLIEVVDSLYTGAKYVRLKDIFLTSSRFEWMFWDMAYRMEAWPV
ncbi:thiaminase II [Stetteria hydrogenophila]